MGKIISALGTTILLLITLPFYLAGVFFEMLAIVFIAGRKKLRGRVIEKGSAE